MHRRRIESATILGSETAQLARDMETLGHHLRGGEDYSQEDALTDELNNLHDFANSDDGAALYEQLKKLNEQLEASGVKAFGEMEEASYRKQGGTGDWVVPALKEDIEACKTELQMQVSADSGEKVALSSVFPACCSPSRSR